MRYSSFALLLKLSVVSMRPLVMLLDGGPAAFLDQNKALMLRAPLTIPGTGWVPGSMCWIALQCVRYKVFHV